MTYNYDDDYRVDQNFFMADEWESQQEVLNSLCPECGAYMGELTVCPECGEELEDEEDIDAKLSKYGLNDEIDEDSWLDEELDEYADDEDW